MALAADKRLDQEIAKAAGVPAERRDVRYLTKTRAEAYLSRGVPKGKLHRIGSWETSPARKAAEELEADPGLNSLPAGR